MAPHKAKRRSRKPRGGGPPRAVASQRRTQRAQARREAPTSTARQPWSGSSLGTYGERPPGPFGNVPVSELAILAGAVGVIVGFFFEHGGPALIAGIVVCTLAVAEVTAREHFSGYRSHSSLLAALPAVALETAIVLILGRTGLFLLIVVVPVYGATFWWLRKRFERARHMRMTSRA
jgi:hypothetical protein